MNTLKTILSLASAALLLVACSDSHEVGAPPVVGSVTIEPVKPHVGQLAIGTVHLEDEGKNIISVNYRYTIQPGGYTGTFKVVGEQRDGMSFTFPVPGSTGTYTLTLPAADVSMGADGANGSPFARTNSASISFFVDHGQVISSDWDDSADDLQRFNQVTMTDDTHGVWTGKVQVGDPELVDSMTAHRQYVLSDNKLASVEETLLYPFTRKENYLDDRGYVYDSIDNHKVFEILRALDKMENYAVDWTATIYEGDADAVVTYNPTTWPTLAQQANASPKAAVANAFWNGRITRYVLFMASDDTRCVVTATADGDMLKVTRVYTPRK